MTKNVESFTLSDSETGNSCKCLQKKNRQKWQIYKLEYSTAMKMRVLYLHARVWISLKNIILNERSQTQRTHGLWFHLYKFQTQAKPFLQCKHKDIINLWLSLERQGGSDTRGLLGSFVVA